MVTVTLPIRPAVAPQPDRMPPPAAGDAGATGFGAVFALLGPESPSADRAPPTDPEPLAEAMPERASPDAADDRMGEVRQEAGQDAGPPPGQIAPPPPLLEMQAVVLLDAEPFAGAADAPVGPLASGQALPPVQPLAPVMALLPESPGAIALPFIPHAPPVTGTAVIGSAFLPAAAPAAAMIAAQQGAEDGASAPAASAEGQAAETGLFLLAEPSGPALRAPALPIGMPAFWAAREAAATVPAEDPAPIDGAAEPVSAETIRPVPPKPAEAMPVGHPPGPDDTGEMPALPDARAAAAPSTSQPLAIGQQPMPSGQTLAPPATPAAMPPHLPAQIAAAVAARPERPLELRLAPVELGGLTLNLRQDGEILRVVLQADRPDTLDLLRRNGDVLLEELRLAGFDGAALSFGDGGGAQDRPTVAGTQAAPATEIAVLPPSVPAFAPVPSAQGLDLRL